MKVFTVHTSAGKKSCGLHLQLAGTGRTILISGNAISVISQLACGDSLDVEQAEAGPGLMRELSRASLPEDTNLFLTKEEMLADCFPGKKFVVTNQKLISRLEDRNAELQCGSRPLLPWLNDAGSCDLLIVRSYPQKKPVMLDLQELRLQFDLQPKGSVTGIHYINNSIMGMRRTARIKSALRNSFIRRLRFDPGIEMARFNNDYITYQVAVDNVCQNILNFLNAGTLSDFRVQSDEFELSAFLLK